MRATAVNWRFRSTGTFPSSTWPSACTSSTRITSVLVRGNSPPGVAIAGLRCDGRVLAAGDEHSLRTLRGRAFPLDQHCHASRPIQAGQSARGSHFISHVDDQRLAGQARSSSLSSHGVDHRSRLSHIGRVLQRRRASLVSPRLRDCLVATQRQQGSLLPVDGQGEGDNRRERGVNPRSI